MCGEREPMIGSPAPTHRRDATASAHTGPAPSAHLTDRIASGDEHAFGAFYELWFDRAYAMARGITRRDESFCLDVVQDCMMRVVRKMRALPDEPAVEAWMTRVLFTTSIDRLRQDRRRARREQRVAREAAVVDTSGPQRRAEDQERDEWLRARLEELPERDRQLIVERFAGDKTLDAVGAAFGISGDAAHGRIRRALRRLRAAAEELIR